MSTNQSFQLTKNFLEQRPACAQALKHLRPATEIRILVDGLVEGALFYKDGKVLLEPRPAHKPDVEFVIFPEAIRRLQDHPATDMADLGVEIVREIASGHIKVRVCGKVLGVLRNGYLGIIKEAGPEFTKYLASHGLVNISKVVSAIKGLKSKG